MPFDPSCFTVSELRARFAAPDAAVTPALLRALQRDPRRGVRALHEILDRRLRAGRAEQARQSSMLHFERVLWSSGVRHVAGVDEVGVGPLAGPVFAAAVVFPPDVEIAGIDDSKRLDPPTRERLEREIRRAAVAVAVGEAAVAEIDELNIYHASLLAMRRAIETLSVTPEHVLIDARELPDLPIPQNSFSRGDGLDFSIAAASIVAKTARDRRMQELDGSYPGYGFGAHKGYATREHQEAIRRLGPSPIHRRSFTFIEELTGSYSDLFYRLQERLAEAADRAALTACEAEVAEHRAALADEEHKKLRLSLRRRWQTL